MPAEPLSLSTSNVPSKASPTLPAFRLGFALSEFMGQCRQAYEKRQRPPQNKHLIGFSEAEAPRFTFSHRYFSDEGAWWHAALHLVSLAEKVDLFDDDGAAIIKQLPDQIQAYAYTPNDRSALISPRDFYNLLEPWSHKMVGFGDDGTRWSGITS